MKNAVIVVALLAAGGAFYLRDAKVGFGCLIVAALLVDPADFLAAMKEAVAWKKGA